MKYYVVDTLAEANQLISDSYQALVNHINNSEEQITVNLPIANTHEGTTIHKNISPNGKVVLTPPVGTMIDGETSFTLDKKFESIGVFSDGVEYFIE